MKKLDERLKNKTVIVTAGNQGGGAALSLRYAASSANVVVIADKNQVTDPNSVNSVTNEIIKAGGSSITLVVDLNNDSEIKTAVSKVVNTFKGVDIVINNYSILNLKPSKMVTSDDFNNVTKNIHATFFVSQACIDELKKSNNPHVINIAPPLEVTSATEEACQHHLLFSISKYAMSFCTMGMAKEFKPYGIAFNSLWQERPIATPTLERNFENDIIKGSNRPEVYAEAAYLISLKSSRVFTGNFLIDEEILKEAGIDPSMYAIDPSAPPIKDIFLPGVDYDILHEALKPLRTGSLSNKD